MSTIQKWTVTEPYVDIEGTLLEGPYYDETRNQLRFVDIWEQKLYFVDLDKGPDSLESIDTDVPIGVTANIEKRGDAYNDKIIVGAKHGFATVDLNTGELSYIRKVWNEQDGPGKEERMRFNDGAVDSHGRFWAGAMNDPKVQEPTDEGVLFRLDPDLKVHRMVTKMTIPNGIGWNAKNDTMYVTDSPTGKIFAFDFNAETGEISNRRVHFHLDDGSGVPDGFAMDEEGCIWTAIYGGSKVLRISPEGKVIGEISLPTRNVTCAEFVGTELFITTAKDEEADKFPTSARYSGKLFKVDVGIRGKPKNKDKFHFRP
ncbi:regucalcin like protein [Thermoascus aurantiacus ATCC 26904]